MYAGFNLNSTPSPREIEFYRNGFKDCLNELEKTVKKLGKEYHKEFLYKLKNLGGKYVSCSATLSTHKCNCDFCELNMKEEEE